jgi:hypothetical protein
MARDSCGNTVDNPEAVWKNRIKKLGQGQIMGKESAQRKKCWLSDGAEGHRSEIW